MKKLKAKSFNNPRLIGLWVGVFAVIGVGTLLLTHAASPGSDTGKATTCVFSDGNKTPAFCDSFDQPAGNGTQTGDLDPILWGVSRIGNIAHNNGITPSHNPCSGTGFVQPPLDARICNGQYVESNNDGGSVTGITTYPKQPFDFTGRTGKVVFDVSNDTSGTHGAWPDFVITDEPVPVPVECISECGLAENSTPVAKNEIGFAMASSNEDSPDWGIVRFWMTKNGALSDLDSTEYGAITKGTRAAMDHIEVRVSTTRIDVWGNVVGKPIIHIAGADIPGGLGFSSGLVWMNDVHYNARKAIEPGERGTMYDHSFAWDNLGFDGPPTYRDLGYDVPLANLLTHGTNQNGDSVEVEEGYATGGDRTFTVSGVRWDQVPSSAKVVLTAYATADSGGIPLSVSLNGNTPVSTTIANFHGQARSFKFPTSNAVAGNNTIRITSSNKGMIVANVSLILVAAAPVPGSGTTPPTTFAPGDYDHSGVVDVFDLSRLLASFNKTVTPGAIPDLDNNGIINVLDLSKLLSNWTK